MVTENLPKGKDKRTATTEFYKRLFDRIRENKTSLKDISPEDWIQLEAICCRLDADLANDVIMFAATIEETFNGCLKYYRPRRTTSGIFFPQQSRKVQKHIVYRLYELATTSSHHVTIAETIDDEEEQEAYLSKASNLANSIDAHLEIVYGAIKTNLGYDKMLKIAEKEIKKAVSLSKSPKEDQKILACLSRTKIPRDCAFFLREDLKKIANKAITERTPESLPTQNLSEPYRISQE